MQMRREHDLLGDREVPAEAYYGVHTLRAVENFPISATPISIYPDLIVALASIKLAAAKTNCELKLLDQTRADAIVAAAEEIEARVQRRAAEPLEDAAADQAIAGAVDHGDRAGGGVAWPEDRVVGEHRRGVVAEARHDGTADDIGVLGLGRPTPLSNHLRRAWARPPPARRSGAAGALQRARPRCARGCANPA